jgi:hypothetical protein
MILFEHDVMTIASMPNHHRHYELCTLDGAQTTVVEIGLDAGYIASKRHARGSGTHEDKNIVL